ncbi:MAG: hypothetical protein ACK4GQ_00765 [Candidatus Hadarchaeales archaeon]
MKKKVAAVALVAMMLTVAVPAVGAQTTAQSWESLREAYIQARLAYLSAVSEWISAREEFLQARYQWRHGQMSLSDFVDKAKNSAQKACEMMIKHLEMLKAGAQASRGLTEEERTALLSEIDNYIAELNNHKTQIQNAVVGEVRNAVDAMRNYWLSIRVRVKQITAHLMVVRAEVLLRRCEALAAKIEARIIELKEEGVDTAKLESWLQDFNDHIQAAASRIENAKQKVSEITDNVTFWDIFSAASKHARYASEYLRNALKNLRDIVREIRAANRTINLSGCGSFIGKGSGTATISLQGGVVKIWALVDNITVRVSQNANVIGFADYTYTALDNGEKQYVGKGYGKVTGHDITVYISTPGSTTDEAIIEAHGSGTLTATGTGTYRTFSENKHFSGEWGTATEVTLGTGEVQEGGR